MAMVRAAGIDDGVSEAVVEGYRAVELARRGADETLVAALAALARALYFAGDLDEAWSAASRAVEHPDAAPRAPGDAVARAILALVAADRGRLTSARGHAEAARAIVGPDQQQPELAGRDRGRGARRGAGRRGRPRRRRARVLVYAERLRRGRASPPSQHAWLLVRLADVRRRRGRLDEADGDACAGHARSSPSFATAERCRCSAPGSRRSSRRRGVRPSGGEILELPTEAELAVLRLLATDLSAREIGAELFLSPNTVRSHIRAIYRKLGVGSREDAVARADAVGLLGETQSPR